MIHTTWHMFSSKVFIVVGLNKGLPQFQHVVLLVVHGFNTSQLPLASVFTTLDGSICFEFATSYIGERPFRGKG